MKDLEIYSEKLGAMVKVSEENADRNRDKMYDQYKDPHTNKVIKVSDNVGTHEEYCSDCKVKNICCGTYHTAYEICGKSVIKPYV